LTPIVVVWDAARSVVGISLLLAQAVSVAAQTIAKPRETTRAMGISLNERNGSPAVIDIAARAASRLWQRRKMGALHRPASWFVEKMQQP
jgi:hypothetical protein